jgi:hypothetical protein
MGHWVVIEFELKYKTDRQRTPKSLRNVLLRVGDSLVAKDNPPFKYLLLEHLCLLDVLCAVCKYFMPTLVETVNLTLDKYQAGCDLPVQVRGNGCAAYAVATIAAAHVRHVCAVENMCRTNSVLAHEPGSNVFEVKLRLRPACHRISLHTPPEDGARPLLDLLSLCFVCLKSLEGKFT